jgi:hypothetical protein
MAKRPNRLPPIDHEQRQLETLKALQPNTTPQRYRALSNGLLDVAISALDIAAALEGRQRPGFERLYNLVDGLADLVDGGSDDSEPEHETTAVETPAPADQPSRPAASAVKGVTTVKTTIIGRPDKVEVNGDTVTLHLTYTPQPGANGAYSLPKGVPAPQAVSTPVLAYVGRKQFEKVKAQLDIPEDALIIEGAISQVIDGVMTVYASNITSKLLQAAKVEQQKTAAQPSNRQ